MFLLINNYQSEETMPYIVSAEKFASYDAAMQAAKNAAEDAMVNEYTEKYKDDQLEMEVANNSVYITGIGKDENGEPKQNWHEKEFVLKNVDIYVLIDGMNDKSAEEKVTLEMKI